MIFNSVNFIFSLIILTILFYISPNKSRWVLLLIASCIFYMVWDPILIFLMIFIILINHVSSLLIYKYTTHRKYILLICLLINFGCLFIFKYSMFFNDTFRLLFAKLNIPYRISDFNIILPMGISFYTFQATGYTIDVYRNDIKPERNFLKVILFIIFFPQLVAGPIERTTDLMPQLFTKKRFKIENIIMGFKYMIFGFFKKVVIADRVAILVNTIYKTPTSYEGLAFIIATVFFAFQVYCDFCGYSEIAKGAAKLFDIDLMDNFKTPYMSKSIREFWSRWHISLSTWFKDYLYIPLGGNRAGTNRKYFNLFVTFIVSGLWHGANWTYIVWGALHGILQILEDVISVRIRKLKSFLKIEKDMFATNIIFRFFKIIFTFIIVCFAYIFFRSNTISDSIYILKNMFTGAANWSDSKYIFNTLNNMGLQLFEVVLCFGLIIFLIILEIFSQKENIHKLLSKKSFYLQFLFYYIITVLVFTLGVFHDAGAFIYFQF